MAAILKKFSVEFLLGVIINVLAVTWLVSSRVAGDEVALADLKNRAVQTQLDHDILTKVHADVENLVKSVDEIKAALLGRK
jgi:hypothetical protein